MNHLAIPMAVGLGGFAGALARFYISGGITKAAGTDYSFVGTLTVNLIGCFLIGALSIVALRTNHVSPLMQKCLMTGLLGSLTTFSTFAVDSLNLMQTGRVGAAMINISVNLLAGLLLVWGGMMIAGHFFPAETSA